MVLSVYTAVQLEVIFGFLPAEGNMMTVLVRLLVKYNFFYNYMVGLLIQSIICCSYTSL